MHTWSSDWKRVIIKVDSNGCHPVDSCLGPAGFID
jgi:hypothetical protein